MENWNKWRKLFHKRRGKSYNILSTKHTLCASDRGLLCKLINDSTDHLTAVSLYSIRASVTSEWVWRDDRKILTGENWVRGEKLFPVTFCLRKRAYELIRDRNQSSGMIGRRLTSWAITRSQLIKVSCFRGTEMSAWLSQNPANGPRHEPFECSVQFHVILI